MKRKRRKSAQIVKRIKTDDRWDIYDRFWDSEIERWAASLSRLTEDSPIDSVTINFILSVKSASTVCRFPSLLVKQLESFTEGLTDGPAHYSRDELDLISNKISGEFKRAERDIPAGDVLNAIYPVFGNRFAIGGTQTTHTFARNEWKRLCMDPPFLLLLSMSLKIGYPALFFAYEDFVASCIRLVCNLHKSKPLYRPRIEKHLESTFGEDILFSVWSKPEICLAREVRHSLVHNGGRITPKFNDDFPSHDFQLCEGELQILPTHALTLLEHIRSGSLELARAAMRRLVD